MTVAVSQIGMVFGLLIEGMESAIKDSVMSILSPMGSKRAPIFDFCLRILAKAPSKKSVKTAMIKMIKASLVFLHKTKCKKIGLSTRREKDMILGIVTIPFLFLFLISSANFKFNGVLYLFYEMSESNIFSALIASSPETGFSGLKFPPLEVLRIPYEIDIIIGL